MRKWGNSLKIILVFSLLLLPFALSLFNCSQATSINHIGITSHNFDTSNAVFIAGDFHHFDVTLSTDAKKVSIVAYHGNALPDVNDRNVGNYYRWEYNGGEWKDASGHECSYLVPSRCTKVNQTYSFYLAIDQKTHPGKWTIKLFVDDQEFSSQSTLVIIVGLQTFLSSILGVFESRVDIARRDFTNALVCSDRKQQAAVAEKDTIFYAKEPAQLPGMLVDQKEMLEKLMTSSSQHIGPNEKDESLQSVTSTYPRSKLKVHHAQISSVTLRKGGSKVYGSLFGTYQHFFVFVSCLLLLSAACMPFFTRPCVGNENEPTIVILNVQSYPSVGGEWVVRFTTVGTADLIITAVNGTTWGMGERDPDLQFLSVKDNDTSWYHIWLDQSVVVSNYSSDDIGYEISRVFTPGVHTLKFQFGDDVVYAHNDATDWWWNESWVNRKPLTINASQVDDDLTNFPVLVSFTDTDLRDDAQNNGNDVVFTNATGTKLNHEIESFNGTTGELIAWVNVTSLSSSTNTNLWMYYNNDGCTNQENVEGTWDANYVGVWHFHNDSLDDSTANSYDGSNVGTTYDSNCKMGGGRSYNGNDKINITNFANISTELTAEIWVYRDSGDSQAFIRLFTEGSSWNDNDWCLYWRTSQTNVRLVINDNDYSEGGSYTNRGTWFHVAVTYDTGDAYLYNNGSQDADLSGQYGASINNVESTLTIGNEDGIGRPWVGLLDEARISNINRSASWLSTSFNTMNDPSVFLSRGDEENVTDTHVENIEPYTLTYKPYILIASAPSGLDNVILWYRYSTDNISWGNWVQNETDSTSPWQWSFNFSNGTGYYEFYSIGNKSGLPDENPPGSADTICYFNQTINTDPIIDVIYPLNGSFSIPLQPTCRIYANDSDGDALTVRWYENTTGSFVLRNTNASVSADSIVSYEFSQFNNYYTTYWWRISINDSNGGWANATYLFTTRYIATSVDTIYPYNVTESPFTITASGDTDIDSVTLWYRWSEDNQSWDGGPPDWDILTYDDFEGVVFDWGNYTDGGGDCEPYTGGTFAHQGSNAANIQDNSGVASSFYHTAGIDVDNPEYTSIKVDFWFYADGMEDGEDFWVRYYNGSSWLTVADYDAGDEFVNGQFYHEVVYINETDYTFPNNMQIRFQCDASSNVDDIYIDEIYVNATTGPNMSMGGNWQEWSNINNPDTSSPWSWEFTFPNGTGYYEFYSVGKKVGASNEPAPGVADAFCYYDNPAAPIINSYDLRNSTGSKLNNATGLLDATTEYCFTVNVTDMNGWTDIKYINITAWYDFGSESTIYNQTTGGNLNMFLQYRNILGVKEFLMIWPDDEVQLVSGNCTTISHNSTTRIFQFSFVPLGQVRWANSNGSWDGTQNTTNDPYSWNFNITVTDITGFSRWKTDEYGIYRYTSVTADQDWVDVLAAPGFNDSSSIVTIAYSSNYDFNMTIYFEENLTNTSWGDSIPIANNVYILANADVTDDITYDVLFLGIGEEHAVDIINSSGVFTRDGVGQAVNVQFDVFIPLGTYGGRYTARVATKISHAT